MLRSMDKTAGRGPAAFVRALVAFALGFAVGAVPALWFAGPLSATKDSGSALGIMSALLAFGGLLTGFVASLMLFSGRLENPSRLTFEMAVAYRARLRFLLASQASTLVASLLQCVLAVSWMVLYAIHCAHASLAFLAVVVFGFAGVCVLRMLLLPMQLFELHEEALDAAVSILEEEARARYAPTDDR